MTITVSMIKSFTDKGDYCIKSYPCQHGPFEVILKDGRKASKYLDASDVYSIMYQLYNMGVVHKSWHHFSEYAILKTLGWHIRPANEILTQMFKKKIIDKELFSFDIK